MKPSQRELVVNRILCGYVFYQSFQIRQPSFEDIIRADLLYQDILEDIKYERWILYDEWIKLFKHYKFLTNNFEDRYKELKDMLDLYKIKYYESGVFDEGIKRKLNQIKGKINYFDKYKHWAQSLTAEGYADICRQEYLLANSIYTNNKKVSPDYFLLCRITKFLNKNAIGIHSYRELARTEPWRSYWSVDKERVFGCASKYMTEEQRNICLFSKMYDNVYESAECPSEEVINDDDCLDGWFLLQREENKNEKKKKELDKRFSKYDARYNEIFVPVRNEEEAKLVQGWNDDVSKAILRKRQQAIKEKGLVRDKDLPDIKQKLQMELNKLRTQGEVK